MLSIEEEENGVFTNRKQNDEKNATFLEQQPLPFRLNASCKIFSTREVDARSPWKSYKKLR